MVHVIPQRAKDLVQCIRDHCNFPPADPNYWNTFCTERRTGFNSPFGYADYDALQDIAYAELSTFDFDNPPIPFRTQVHDWHWPAGDWRKYCPNVKVLRKIPIFSSGGWDYVWQNDAVNCSEINKGFPDQDYIYDLGYAGPLSGAFFTLNGISAYPGVSESCPAAWPGYGYIPLVVGVRTRLTGYSSVCASRRSYRRNATGAPYLTDVVQCGKIDCTPNTSGPNYSVDAFGRITFFDNMRVPSWGASGEFIDWGQYGYSGTVPFVAYWHDYGSGGGDWQPSTAVCPDCSCTA